MRLSKDTVIRYVVELEAAYVLFSLQNTRDKFAERESNPKQYFSDNGILNLFLLNKDSALLENLVAISLRRKYGENVGYFFEPTKNIDLDFYIPDQEFVVQACYSMDDLMTREREIKSIINFSRSYPHSQRRYCIVTHSTEETINTGNVEIHVTPLWKFLLEL